MQEEDPKRNGSHPDPENIDKWLQDQLAPDPKRVDLLVRRVLASEPSVRHPRLLLGRIVPVAMGLSAMALLLVGIIVLSLSRRTPIPERVKENTSGNEIVAVITNRSGPVELRYEGNAGSFAANDSSQQNSHIRIFNLEGILAAQINDGDIRYIVTGGDK
jgi:hypothetical protein